MSLLILFIIASITTTTMSNIIGHINNIRPNPLVMSCIDQTFHGTRNNYLRLYIFHNTMIRQCLFAIKSKSIKTYNSVRGICYDAQITYYSIPPEDRELIEQIINMHF